MSSTTSSMADLQQATARAQAARNAGRTAEMLNALHQIKTILQLRAAEHAGFDAIVSLQGITMAIEAADLELARQFAELCFVDVTGHLAALNQQFAVASAQHEYTHCGILLQEAYVCTVTFIPRAHAPVVPWLIRAFAKTNMEAGQALLFLLEQVRPALTKAGWHEWPYSPTVIGPAELAAAQTLVNTANSLVEADKGAFEASLIEQALHCALNALGLIPKDDRTQLMADCKNVLGLILHSLGTAEQEDALAYFEECIAIEDDLGRPDLSARDHANAGGVALRLSAFCAENEDTRAPQYSSRAEQHLTAARDYFRTHGPPGDLRNVLVNFGAFYVYVQRKKDALQAFEEALGLTGAADDEEKSIRIRVLGNLGSLNSDLGQHQPAVEYFDQAIQLLSPMSDAEPFLICHGGMGKALCHLNRHADAEMHLTGARDRLNTLRSSFTSEITNMQLVKGYHWIYEWSIVCLSVLAQANPTRWAEAFTIAENVKWRLLTTLMRYLPLGMVDSHLEPLVKEEELLLAQLRSALENPLTAVVLKDPSVDARLKQIWKTLESRYPNYVALRRQETLSASQVAVLLDAEVPVLVEYFLSQEADAAIAFIVPRSGAATGCILPTTKTQLIQKIRNLRAQEDKETVAVFNESAAELHRLLVEPLASHFLPGAGVCFVPYGEMHNLPFATLFDGRQYLAETHGIVIAPTASGLRWWTGKDRQRKETCWLFAATQEIECNGQRLPNLTLFYSLAKKHIARLFAKSAFLEAPPADKAAILQQTKSDWDVVHIACHGIARPNALESFLAMPGTDPNRHLTALEIASQVASQATLVTLSACKSAVAEASTGDDLAGLAQAFLIAGSSSVLATNAEVVQGLGVELTSAFYRYWTGHGVDGPPVSKLAALRLAQTDAARRRGLFGLGGRTWHPQQWGVFQLYGNWH